MDKSECQNFRGMLDPYLDNELLVETSHSLLDHLSFCPECAAESERRIELRRLLTEALMDDDGGDSEDISRKRIQMALDRERHPRAPARIRWFALAASLILALTLGAVYWLNAPVSQPAFAAMDHDAVENHQACALRYPPDWTFDGQRAARKLTPHFAPLIDAVGRNQTSYELIEGHICRYQQRQYVHLIFRGNGHTVSVFIENDEPGGNPKSSRPPEIDQTSYKAFQVASVDTGLHRIFVVSDLPGSENLTLANQLFPPTLDFIQTLEVGVG